MIAPEPCECTNHRAGSQLEKIIIFPFNTVLYFLIMILERAMMEDKLQEMHSVREMSYTMRIGPLASSVLGLFAVT